MRVLVLGSGGREHSLTWALARSREVSEVFAAPGNPGIAEIGTCFEIDAADPEQACGLADKLDVDLVVVGPETPLVAGVVDALSERGRLAFGPIAKGARLEGSKAWMKEVLDAARVPTASYGTFSANDESRALAFLETLSGLYVVKTDGLAAGKGVIVTESIAEARDAVRSYLSGAAFGDSGRTLVIEEGLSGPELSLLVMCDGTNAFPLAPAQDHKRAEDGDRGPNTGGMGAYSPVSLADLGLVDTVMELAVRPTMSTLRSMDIDYRGILYAGIMLTPDGPKVLEYNVRFGDPECQVVVPRLTSDLAVHCVESAQGNLVTPIRFDDTACVTVVMAAENYPENPRTGDVIEGIGDAAKLEGVHIFHAGTRQMGGDLVTAGGRVLDVTATAATVAQARQRAYGAVEKISWAGAKYRTDIAVGAQ